MQIPLPFQRCQIGGHVLRAHPRKAAQVVNVELIHQKQRHQQLLRAGQVAVVQVKQRQLLVKKTVIPVVVALFLFSMFSRIFIENGAPDYFLIWLACGVPFGIGKMFTLIPIGFGISGTVGVVALNLVLGGLIGGVILIWKLAVALWYLPLTIYRLVT